MGIGVKDLRIGNCVKFNDVSCGHRDGILKTIDLLAVSYNSSWVDPIVLTEEWLLKAGFVNDSDYGNWHIAHLDIYKKQGGLVGIHNETKKVYWYFAADDDYYSWVKELEHVHQLQNLFFALTGKELTV